MEPTPEHRLAAFASAVAESKALREALEFLDSIKSTEIRVADLYDQEPRLASAMALFYPGYEYPDYSHMTLAQLHRNCRKQSDPQMVALKGASMKRALDALAQHLSAHKP